MVCLVWRLVGWEGEDGNEGGKKERHTHRERDREQLVSNSHACDDVSSG